MHLQTEKAICRRICGQKRQFEDAFADRSGNLRTHSRTETATCGHICGQRWQSADAFADNCTDKNCIFRTELQKHLQTKLRTVHQDCPPRRALLLFSHTWFDQNGSADLLADTLGMLCRQICGCCRGCLGKQICGQMGPCMDKSAFDLAA